MSRSNNAIPGEASESDSEEEINTSQSENESKKVVPTPAPAPPSSSTPVLSPQGSLQGRIVAGEAPESDEELGGGSGSVSSAASVSSIASLTSSFRGSSTSRSADVKKSSSKPRYAEEIKYKTLLHKKLRERNIALWRNITELVHSTAAQAARDLNTADQQLLRSQGVLQDTAAQLRAIQSNVTTLRERLDDLAATPFLPQVTIPEQVH